MLPSMPFLGDKNVSNAHNEDALSVKKVCVLPEEKGASTCRSSNNSKTNIPTNSAKPKLGVKVQRKLEANKAMFLNTDPSADDLKDTMYAAMYFEKVKTRLSLQKINSSAVSKFDNFLNIMDKFDSNVESPCDLYNKLKDLFGEENSDLSEEFLTFLTPGQATEVGQFMDYFTLTCMADFIERSQIYFANRPAQLRKIFWCLKQLSEKPETELTMDSIKATILPLLKGNQYLIDWFLKLFPTEKPPDSLLNNGYEIIDLEKANDLEELSSIESQYEFYNIPHINENYGNDQCTCSCHNLENEKYKNRIRHCLACGTKYIQGRMYVQHGRALRPVHLNWPEDTCPQINHTRRLCCSSLPRHGNPRKRTACVDPLNISVCVKPDSDDDRVSPKRKKKGKKILPILKSLPKMNDDMNPAHNKTCSKNILKDDDNLKDVEIKKKDAAVDATKSQTRQENEIAADENLETLDENNSHKKPASDENAENKEIANRTDAENAKLENDNDCDSREITEKLPANSESEPNWTREEDKIILLMLRDETNHAYTLNKIKELLPHKSVDDIKERFQSVLNLVQKIVSQP